MIKMLVVDDEPANLEIWTALMAHVAPTVTDIPLNLQTAESALQALLLLSQWTPEILVTDVRMPDMDGIALLREIRSRFPPIACYLMTGNPEAPEVEGVLREGLARSVLAKPITVDTMYQWFRAAVRSER